MSDEEEKKDDETPTYLSKGVFARNSTFDVWDAAKRWGPGTDPYLYGLPEQPFKKFFDRFKSKPQPEVNMQVMNAQGETYDEMVKRRKTEKEQRKKERDAKIKKAEQVRRERNKPRELSEEEKLERHRKEYYCYICNAPSAGPYRSTSTTYDDIGDDMAARGSGISHSHTHYHVSWSSPVNLETCPICSKWTCYQHHNDERLCSNCQSMLVKKQMAYNQWLHWKKWGILHKPLWAFDEWLNE